MRISDWSSDVCSSDLLRAYWNVLSALGAASLRLPAVVAALETIGSAGKFAPDLVHLRPLWRAVDAMMTATRAGPELTARHRSSEEHTSELQSLMCISYAVLCLKTEKTSSELRSLNRYSYAAACSRRHKEQTTKHDRLT